MNYRKQFCRLARNEDASTGILVGAALPALLGGAAMAIDLGSIYLAQRELQGIADAAAMAATQGDIAESGMERASLIIQQSGVKDIHIEVLTPGDYLQDATLAYDERFDPDATIPTAASIELRREVPLFFGRILTSGDFSVIRAKAISQRTDVAAFSIGSRLAGLSGGLGNQILSQLAGTELGLTVMDVNGLAGAEVDLLGFADALKARVSAGDATYGEVFGQEVSFADAVDALADAIGPGTTADTLRGIVGHLNPGSLMLGDVIDLGPMGNTDFTTGNSGLTIDAFTLLRAILEQGQEQGYVIELDLSVLGLADATARVVGGSGWRSSPLLSVTSATDYVLRTSQARILIEVGSSLGGGFGLGALQLPLYAELAEAEARLSDIRCEGEEETDGVDLAVTPALGTFAIASIDETAFPDLDREVALSPVQLVTLPVASLSGFAEIDLGGASPQPVHFGLEAIEQRETKTVSTNDLAQAIATSLAEELDLEVTTVGVPLGVGSLAKNAARVIAGLAPDLDIAFNAVARALGLGIGQADVRIDKYRCGVPQIVA